MNSIITDKHCNYSKLQCQLLERSNILIIFLPGIAQIHILVKSLETMLFAMYN